jgi:hypothetical protein
MLFELKCRLLMMLISASRPSVTLHLTMPLVSCCCGATDNGLVAATAISQLQLGESLPQFIKLTAGPV